MIYYHPQSFAGFFMAILLQIPPSPSFALRHLDCQPKVRLVTEKG